MLLYKNVTFFYLDLSEKDLLLQLLLQGNLQNRADLQWRWPLRTRQSPKHVFLGFGQQRFQVSRERIGTSPSHLCSPVAAESHSHDQVTNSTPQQPWQRLNSISQLFEDPQAVMETRKEEELPYEEGSCGRGTC